MPDFQSVAGLTSVPALLADLAAAAPEATALSAPNRSPLCFSRLWAQVRETARVLNSLGIQRNDRVAVVMADGPEMAALFLSVSAVATCAPLNPAYRAGEFEFYLSDLNPCALIVQADVDSQAIAVARARGIRVLELVPDRDGAAGTFSFRGISAPASGGPTLAEPEDTALIVHTSGSTDTPKQVGHTHAIVTKAGRNLAESLRLTAEDRYLSIMPLFHAVGIDFLMAALTARSASICTPGFHAVQFFEWFDEFKPTWYAAVPTMHQSILARAAEHRASISTSQLRFIRSGSAAMSNELLLELERTFGVPVSIGYGMTETCQITSNLLPPEIRRPHSVGRALGCEVAVMDAAGAILPAEQEGEVVVRGGCVIAGYLNNAEATRKSFAGGWFHTGDQGRLDRDGYLFLTGRLKEIINRGGEKIAPLEVDEALMSHPAVLQATAFAFPDAQLGEDIGAAVVLRPGAAATALELREFVAGRLANFKVPSRILLVEEIPTGPTGKPLRNGLATTLGLTAEGQAAKAPAPFVAPGTGTEIRLAAIWKDVLGLQSEVGAEDDFFEAGGDSILGVQLCSAIAVKFGVEFSFPRLFDARTVKGIAAQIDQIASDDPGNRRRVIQRSSSMGEFPLSFAQRQHWFLDQFEERGANFIHVNACCLRGPLDVDRLTRSLDSIVARHAILRTTYHQRDGQPYQRVSEAATVVMPVVDLRDLPEAERPQRVLQLAREESWHRFDLSVDHPFRAKLLQVHAEEHVLLLGMHHIASDGWSFRLILQELSEAYSARCEGRDPRLPDLPIQYSDYIQFQHQQFERGCYNLQIEYWKKQMAGSPELLLLPTDRQRPERQSYRGGVEVLDLPLQLAAELKAFGLRQHATLHMVLLSAFQVLLHRYSGEEDLVVGSPIAGRTHPETANLIGLFSKVLPMRSVLSGDPSFEEFVGRTRQAALDAQANQDAPTEKWIEQLSIHRSARHPALFQVMFLLQNLATETAQLGPVALTPLDFDPGIGQFDLSLDVRERQQGLHCALNFNADLYDGATAGRILRHYRTILEAIVSDSSVPISRLNILPEDERRQLLTEWNQTAADYPRESSISSLIEAQARAFPESIAVEFQGEQLTYRELDRRANGMAHRLRALGAQRGVLIGVALQRSTALAVSLLAILKSGGAYVPLDPEYPQARLTSMIEDAGCPLLITTSAREGDFTNLGIRILLADGETFAPADEPPSEGAMPLDGAYVIFTSGSTGRPNGVQVQHRALVNNSVFFAKRAELLRGDRVLQFNSISFDTAVEEMFPCWLAGGTLVFWPEPKAPSIVEFLDFVDRQKVTLLDLPTAYWHEWASEMAHGNLRFPASIRTVVIGGEKALAPKLAAWNRAVAGRAKLLNTYGPTEATITATTYEVPAEDSPDPLPIGRPNDNTTLYILDRHMQPVPIGIPGELYIGGDGVSPGYLNRTELTAQRFVPNPFRGLSAPRIYKTGDRARYLVDGNVEFLGRLDEQVKWRGFRIELGELELALARHPQVRAAACCLSGNAAGCALVAYLVSENGHEPAVEDLRGFLRMQLPDYMVPSHWVFLEALPLTRSGKVDRSALRERVPAERPSSTALIAPRTDLEREIAAAWMDVLQLERVGISENFFDLGGHSLMVIQVLSRLRNALHVDVPIRRVFEGPTIGEMAIAVLDTFAASLSEEEQAEILQDAAADPR
jgi:amino acid adenylation domain-containing protein